MTVHTLHLEHRYERYENMMKQAKEQGFQIEWHIGRHDKKNPKKAICEGHKSIVQVAKDNGWSEVIVSEDDLNFMHPNSFNYFIANKPKSFDLYLSFVYVGTVDENHRVISTFSGGCSLYIVNERFYDYFLNIESNSHVDRTLGDAAKEFEYYVPPLIPCEQHGGKSDNHSQKTIPSYRVYFEGRKLYNGE